MISRRSLFGMLGIGAPVAAAMVRPRQAVAQDAQLEAVWKVIREMLDAQAFASYPGGFIRPGTTGVTITDSGHTHPVGPHWGHVHTWTIKT